MQFEYDISADEFVAAQTLYRKTSGRRAQLYQNGLIWIFVGVFFVLVALQEKAMNWIPILLLLLGIWWILAGFSNLLPARHFRGTYQKAELEGKRFHADLTIDGFEVEGEMCGWRVRWPGIKVKGEDNLVFMFYSANTVFAFGKRFLDASQQDEVRRLSGIKSTGADISGR